MASSDAQRLGLLAARHWEKTSAFFKRESYAFAGAARYDLDIKEVKW
jgi:hypothetical protein